MAKKAGGLGRGLGSLFGDVGLDLSVLDPAQVSVDPDVPAQPPAQADKPQSERKARPKKEKAAGADPAENVVFISLDDIKPNGSQPRKVFDQEALEGLASSIREHGVIQPVLLRPSKRGYELVAGERRWRAARMAGLKQIPAIVRELTEQQNMFYALIENMQREDLNGIEEARGMEEMMLTFGLTQEETAKAVGKSRPYVANTLRLLKLPQGVQDMVMSGKLSPGHARAIAGLEGEELQLQAAEKCLQQHWTVRQVESYTGEKKRPGKRRRRRISSTLRSEIDAVERELTEKLGTKVKISGTDRKGKIELDYYSRGELERLIEVLTQD
jgi:ParB family chromosome partitioning protein